MDMRKKLPIGIEDFKEIRTEGFYYVDKTGLIAELLDNWGKVNLFTRPRRFGKSLNMSMLRYFLGYGCDPTLFAGSAIAERPDLCDRYMGRFPVISITLKDTSAMTYRTAREMLCSIIGSEAMRFSYLLDSTALSPGEKARYKQLIQVDQGNRTGFLMSNAVLFGSLLTLSQLLYRHHGQKAILLIDEYDVPLDKAQQSGFYDEMVDLIRNLLGQALKSNESLYFAVLTGCLRIAKESIFTGLNNLKILSITDVRFAGHFGFTDQEVRTMLGYYDLADHYGLIRTWYDGYRFGKTDVYCPWDVINYVDQICADPSASPRAYWINTSGNDIIRMFLQRATQKTRREIGRLVDGGCIEKKIDQELTYRDLYRSIDNIWSVLFTTGYLTQRGETAPDCYRLAIPNLEIRQIFTEQIQGWFQEEVRKDTPTLDAFCSAFVKGDAQTIEDLFNAYLLRTISIRDTGAQKDKKENFYHGILLGLLSHREDWDVDSNAEAGDGFSDILIEVSDQRIGIVVEVKYAGNGDLETSCQRALEQIQEKRYAAHLEQDGMDTIIRYGIACWKKRCRVRTC